MALRRPQRVRPHLCPLPPPSLRCGATSRGKDFFGRVLWYPMASCVDSVAGISKNAGSVSPSPGGEGRGEDGRLTNFISYIGAGLKPKIDFENTPRARQRGKRRPRHEQHLLFIFLQYARRSHWSDSTGICFALRSGQFGILPALRAPVIATYKSALAPPAGSRCRK